MADFPQIGGFNQSDSGGKNTGTSSGTSVSTGSTWTEVFSATSSDSDLMVLKILNTVGTDQYIIDIAIGGAGSEEFLCENLICDETDGVGLSTVYVLPVKIAKGERVSIRTLADSGGRNIVYTMDLFAGGMTSFQSGGSIVPNGVDTAGRSGTAIDPGGTANTKGGYVEITASTPSDFKGFIVAFGNNKNGTISSNNGLADLAIGGSGSEEIILPDIWYKLSSTEQGHVPVFYPIDIPAGTRLAMRAQSTSIDAADRLFTTAIYGVVA